MIKNKNTRPSFSKQQHDFSNAQPGVSMERSTLSRPSRTITALDADNLVPILVDEVLPGDTYKLSCQVLAWLATPIRPFLDNLKLTVHFWFVPNRLGWDNWQRFQGEQINPGDSTSFTVPKIEILGGTTAGVNKLADYFGIPLIATTFEVNALPFRAYNRIWTDFYRDENLQNSLVLDTGDANSTEANHVLKKRGKQKDYITGCLPFAQKGDVTPGIISGTVPVTATGDGRFTVVSSGGAALSTLTADLGGDRTLDTTDILNPGIIEWGDTKLEADLDTAQANTINELRMSFAVQHVYELDARGGTRHPEQLKARWGVTSQDFRLQRPEYLGGGMTNISVSPVPSTSEASSGEIGRLGGYGVAQGNCGGFTHSFVEHGYVIAIASVRSDLTYQEGLARHWTYDTRFDYYEPSFAGLGEQPVYNREVFVSNDANDDLVWGYQERGAHMKYGRSMVTGIMNSSYVTAIDFWHLAEEFTSLPTLNDAFIQGNSPVDRVITVASEPHIVMDAYFTNSCTRVIPVHNTPGLHRL